MDQVAAMPHLGDAPHLADYVIKAGAIYSMTDRRAVYRALALRDEWIVAISQDPASLDGLVTTGTRVVADPGLTILPALDDSHNHMIVAAMSLVERVIPPPPFEDQVRDLGRACQLYNSYGIGAVRDPIVRRGTLQPGCLADIVGYRTDPITCPTDDLLHLRPAFTMVGGRAVYDPEAIL